jgi:type III secretion system YscD/HrpQ family protein
MGAEFIAEEGILKGLILSLEKGEEWTIGRDPDLSTIVIEDPKASRLHMRVRKTDEGYFVENLSDTNPVLIGGEPLTAPTLVHEGDLLTIGGSVFRFYPEGPPAHIGFEVEYPFVGGEAFSEERPFAQAPEEKEPPSEEPPKEEKGEEELRIPFEEEGVFEAGMPSFEKGMPEEERLEETLFEEGEVPQLRIDLTQTTRFILKVIAGPNTGAEFSLDLDRAYLIGTDTASCDIVFNDLSVSREHARIAVSKEGIITIQDLNSRNGVFVDRERVVGTKTVTANAVVALGTSAFLLIDREAPSETIAAPLLAVPEEEEERERAAEEEERFEPKKPVAVKAPPKPPLPAGALVLALIICGLAILFGIGIVSLFQTKEVEVVHRDRLGELQAVMQQFPAVRFTYNEKSGKLFLLGHVRTGIEHNELLYQLRGLGFITGMDDNIVNDEAVWQEMNILLSKHPEFKGVSMHSPEPGVFVLTGYLQTEKQLADLNDYLNVNFNYLSLLQNRIVVEQAIQADILSQLAQKGFAGVKAALSNGDLQLTGYINATDIFAFDKLVEEFKKVSGIRSVRNFVVTVMEPQVISLNVRKGGRGEVVSLPRYRVTGYSKCGDININVVINGRIISRGDCIDGFTVTSIQPNIVFLEREGLKYKIEYNKCKSYGEEE